MIGFAEHPVKHDRPLVSIVMPAWNAAATLAEAVGSVREQTRSDWELLIVDDASTDGTSRLIQTLCRHDDRILATRLSRNAGAAAARNLALSQARGRFVAFLDADDLWLPEKLDRQLAHMARTGAALGFHAYRRDSGRRRSRIGVPAAVTRDMLLRGNRIGCLTAMIDTALTGPVRMPERRLRQDYALWLSLLRRGLPAAGLDAVLAIHRRQPGSLSSALGAALAGTWTVYRAEEGLSRPAAAACLAAHCVNRALARLVPA